MAEVLDSPRYVCCKKYSVSWLFKLAITAPSVPFGESFAAGKSWDSVKEISALA